ncbi:primosomal protein N' [Conchiformibius kuhniae]|uniref:Replication restart protein PriA n=1 Tax=Conchiformibius kuhniae TaxID=211502 RepID=A0ABD8B739_9NEIS|nr:primosomal protein N' [Conchiformibius kuhniae]
MPYCHVAVNTPLPPLTYACDAPLPAGARVLVPFRRRTVVGIVWCGDVSPEIAAEKILPVQSVFDETPLPESWRDLAAFAARYYHFPLGLTVFAALPQRLKETRPCPAPPPAYLYALNESGRAQAEPPRRAAKQQALWRALADAPQSAEALKGIHKGFAPVLADWRQRGWLAQTVREYAVPPPVRTLNDVQNHALARIAQAQGFAPFLLHGITGSGKTEVYLEAMARVLASGKQVLFLLPEIGLTPQLLARLRRRFGEMPIAVLHSQTAAKQRSDDYLRAMSGQVRLVVGTRLAVFTPMADLGLVVVDEEHDASFKQDSDLRYHARDLAVWRAQQAQCAVVLGSATPSLESWHRAQTGAYALLSLPHRAHRGACLPHIGLVDIARLRRDEGIAPAVWQALRDNLNAGGMSLVYLNRRGFAPAVFCGDCGHTFGCPHCSAKTVLHRRAAQMRCHHCGYSRAVPDACPDCGNQDLTAIGHGTQKIEAALRQAFPYARIFRADRDSIRGRDDWQDVYAAAEAGEADILVGTQMLAKGHDFARLNLVAVLNADGSLYSADFRAPERLFAELMQVSGRAGRADAAGRVLIQTALPHHSVFAAVQAQNYAAFADAQCAERQAFALPPFVHQAAVRADAPDFAQAHTLLARLAAELSPQLPPSVVQTGPAAMLMVRLAGRERAQIFLESPSRRDLHRAAALWQHTLQQHCPAHTRWHIDIDPQNM